MSKVSTFTGMGRVVLAILVTVFTFVPSFSDACTADNSHRAGALEGHDRLVIVVTFRPSSSCGVSKVLAVTGMGCGRDLCVRGQFGASFSLLVCVRERGRERGERNEVRGSRQKRKRQQDGGERI